MEGNLAEVQEALAERLADREAIVTAERRLTWAELTDRSRRLANALLDAGVTVRTARSELAPYESGQDSVALYLFNGHEYLEAMLGAFKARAIPGNVNYRYVEAELLQLLGDMAPRAIVFDGRFASELAAVVDQLPQRPLLLQVAAGGGPAEPLLPGAVDYETALAGASPARPPVDWSPDDLYTLYTGGTTGQPKGVLWRQADVFVAAMAGGTSENGASGGRSTRSSTPRSPGPDPAPCPPRRSCTAPANGWRSRLSTPADRSSSRRSSIATTRRMCSTPSKPNG